ncbi:uncharacterized protein [Venturia canescens]|uniref:uncharacterized protein n=1 Tax=Venturia canescens TaxID=32260 RepID=UPI001C9C41E7|nr:uncharacterized protein LOC122414378 [Venturia canescens]
MHSGEKGLFEFGSSGSVFGASGGYVEDWAKRHMGIPRSFAFYVADRSDRYLSPPKIEDFGKGTLKLIQVLATSRRVEPYAESIDEIMTNRTIVRGPSKPRETRPVPWGRETIDESLRSKIQRGAELEIPIEFMQSSRKSGFDYFRSGDTE